jgi:hypothetical protein
MDLEKSLASLCSKLGVINPPSIGWMDKDYGAALGVHWRICHRIEISRRITPETLDSILVHELCHCVLHRAGYNCSAHSWIFLTTFHLMLDKAGLSGAETVEYTAVANWNRWSRKSVRERHVSTTKRLYNSIHGIPNFLQNSNAHLIASKVISSHSYKWMPPWVLHRWHEVSGDTRGAWLAVFHFAKPLCIGSLMLLAVPSTPVRMVAVAVAVVTGTCGLIASKVLKIGADTVGTPRK